jgi:hypothetical protein
MIFIINRYMLKKNPHIGVYGTKDRLLQARLSYERTSLTWKTVKVYKYLGSAINVTPALDDIQDPIFMENPDRAYNVTPIEINASFEPLQDEQMDLSRFGIINPLGNNQRFAFHSYSFAVDGLGRYIMVGDIIEVPFWYQEGRKSYWQVEDIDRKMEFESFMITVTASPMNDTQETTEIPNIPSNSDIMATLKIDMNDEQIANFTEDGYDTTEVVLDNEPVTRDPYDPRPDATEDFLDNPTVLLNQ